jgi:peptidoglycan/LPS O-acetylase OafA/YrhL
MGATTSVEPPNRQLSGLEAGRGIAAMLVLLTHCQHHCGLVFGPFPLGDIFAFGHAGVDFFFVLSGFIIFYAHWGDLGRPKRLPRYIERRFTRIYPLYWVVLTATLVVGLLSKHPFPSFEHIMVSALLLPTVGGIVVVDAWTLQHEVLFYGIFSTLLINKRLGMLVLGAWLIFLIVCAQVHFDWTSGLLSKLSSYFNFEFFLGIGAAWFAEREKTPAPKFLVLLGVSAFLATGAAEDSGLIANANIFTHAGYGLSATAVVLGLVAWERRFGLGVPAILAKLGGASYAIYLIHVLVIGLIWQIIQRAGLQDRLGPTITFIVLASGAAVAGVLGSIWIEKPLLKFFRRRRVASAPIAPEVV